MRTLLEAETRCVELEEVVEELVSALADLRTAAQWGGDASMVDEIAAAEKALAHAATIV
jgi:hypothetical protein